MLKTIACAACLVLVAATAHCHDTWVQTNTNVVRTGDAIHVDLLLGNHGNDHRDFKLAGKVDLKGVSLEVIAPDGRAFDMIDRLTDTGYAPKEGFYTTRFVPAQSGLYTVAHRLEQVMSYAPVRSIKSAKTCFVASGSLDKVPRDNPGYDQVLGHPLELVPQANPVTPLGPGLPIAVRLVYKGQPLANARVSFIPRGTQLAEDFDSQYERMTDAEGLASYTPTEGNYVLVAAHHVAPEERGEGYDATKYSATLTVFVPELCPCCE